MKIQISESRNINIEDIIKLYKANGWNSADKLNKLYNALTNSHYLVLACVGNELTA